MNSQTTTVEDLAIPTIHLNGTPRERLLEQITDTAYAISQAMEKLAAASPNQRDYYLQPPEEWKMAVAQHSSRMERLQSVRVELEAIAEKTFG